MCPFDFARLTLPCAMLAPMERFLQLRERECILSTREPAALVVLQPIDGRGNDALYERAVRLPAVRAAAERAVLPTHVDPDAGGMTARRIAVSVILVASYDLLSHCLSSYCCCVSRSSSASHAG